MTVGTRHTIAGAKDAAHIDECHSHMKQGRHTAATANAPSLCNSEMRCSVGWNNARKLRADAAKRRQAGAQTSQVNCLCNLLFPIDHSKIPPSTKTRKKQNDWS